MELAAQQHRVPERHWRFSMGGPNSDDIPVGGMDMDGDGKSDLVIYRPTNGTWYWLLSSTGYQSGNSGVQWGAPNSADKPLTNSIKRFAIKGQVLAGGSGFSGVTVSLSGTTSAGTGISQSVVTDSNGNYSFSVPAGGNYTVTPSDDVYTFEPASASFNGLSANQSANFTGYISGVSTNPSTPEPPPAPYPNYLASPPAPPAGSCNYTGTWVDSVSGATWSFTQIGSSAAGALQFNAGSCGTTTWTVGGQFTGSVAGLLGSVPAPAFNACSQPAAVTVQAAATFASCNGAAVKETATIPSYVNKFGQTVPGYVNAGTGTLTLASSPLMFTVSSPSQVVIPGGTNNAQMIPMSTGDAPPSPVFISAMRPR